MQTRGLVSDGRNQPYGNRPPHSYGSAASRLMKLIDGSHYDAKLSDHETKLVRLWIETSATYPGTYASLGCGFYPVGLPYAGMIDRCGKCHTMEADINGQKRHRIAGAQRSLGPPPGALRQSLPAGEVATCCGRRWPRRRAGWASAPKRCCRRPTIRSIGQMLAAIEDAHKRLEEGKRFDMPGFRPNQHYIREMQRFGFLPADLKPDDPIDVYAVDRAYWDSFDYRPPDILAGN